MYAFYIDTKEVKEFMGCLLKGNGFDELEVFSLDVSTIANISIDGVINREFLEEETDRYYCTWAELKPVVYNIIKGKKAPVRMKIVMSAPRQLCQQLHSNCKTAFLNIIYENDIVTFTTGSSQINFSLDKAHEIAWNTYIEQFFKNLGIVTNKIV